METSQKSWTIYKIQAIGASCVFEDLLVEPDFEVVKQIFAAYKESWTIAHGYKEYRILKVTFEVIEQ